MREYIISEAEYDRNITSKVGKKEMILSLNKAIAAGYLCGVYVEVWKDSYFLGFLSKNLRSIRKTPYIFC